MVTGETLVNEHDQQWGHQQFLLTIAVNHISGCSVSTKNLDPVCAVQPHYGCFHKEMVQCILN